jgi:hypothetical protein
MDASLGFVLVKQVSASFFEKKRSKKTFVTLGLGVWELRGLVALLVLGLGVADSMV